MKCFFYTRVWRENICPITRIPYSSITSETMRPTVMSYHLLFEWRWWYHLKENISMKKVSGSPHVTTSWVESRLMSRTRWKKEVRFNCDDEVQSTSYSLFVSLRYFDLMWWVIRSLTLRNSLTKSANEGRVFRIRS